MSLKRFGNHIIETDNLLCVKPDGQIVFTDGVVTLVSRDAAEAMVTGLTPDKSPMQPEAARKSVVTTGVPETPMPPDLSPTSSEMSQ